MLDCAPLTSSAERLAGRFRLLTHGRLRAGAAAAGLALARELAVSAQELEFPEREPYAIPDEGGFAVGDQIAVTAHDLAAALSTRPDRADLLTAAVTRIIEVAERV